MDTHNPSLPSLLLISAVLSASVSLRVLAGDGVIVIERQVQPYAMGRSRGIDPYPTAVSANPSAQIMRAANGELSDNDIAGISSGASITRSILPGGNLPGLGNTGSGAGLGAGSAAGHGSGSGSGISGTINGALSSGLAPLNNLGGMAGGR
ncbi:hypothetical protein F0170_20595 [Pseudomonas sp. MAFF 730085]|uniref:Fap n=1 Tax=Pseudomonas kitaguniensis TaxID=2607908 RepID=A0A5N7JXQ6_9PSED|nr:hypothetical protein [Pseudomonas kitaguniensis]